MSQLEIRLRLEVGKVGSYEGGNGFDGKEE
jgi:hypothetical protein